jgi:hypothetical protein
LFYFGLIRLSAAAHQPLRDFIICECSRSVPQNLWAPTHAKIPKARMLANKSKLQYQKHNVAAMASESDTFARESAACQISTPQTMDVELRTLLLMRRTRTNRTDNEGHRAAARQVSTSNGIGPSIPPPSSIPPPQRFARRQRPSSALPSGPSKALITAPPACHGIANDSIQPIAEGPRDEFIRILVMGEIDLTFEAINRFE